MRSLMTIGAGSLLASALVLGFACDAQAQPRDEGLRTAQIHKQRPRTRKAQRRVPTPVPVQRRAPTRITVQPTLRYRLDSTPFPRVDNLGYPGPNAVRQCVSWLAQDHRFSGTVLVPQMRCWWQRS